MEPQQTSQHNYSPLNNPIQQSKPHTSSKSVTTLVLLFIIVLLIAAIGAGGYFSLTSLQNKDNQLKEKNKELATKSTQLLEAEKKINELDAPQKKANNKKRQADLGLFIDAINTYKNQKGVYPSTEPTFFAEEFEKLYITDKIKNFVDPTTKEAYKFTPVATVQTPPGVTLGTIQYQWPGTCLGSEFEDTSDESKAAARLILENGEIYCLNSQN